MCGYACIRCGLCGKKFAEQSKQMACPKCGQRASSDDLKCKECGAMLPLRPGAKREP